MAGENKTENGEREKEEEAKAVRKDESEDQPSPRGVLEVRASCSGSGSDSDQVSMSPAGENKSHMAGGDVAINYGNLQWKKMFGQVKKTSSSAWKFSTMSLLLTGHDLSKSSKKMWRNKKAGRGRSSSATLDELAGDDREFVVPKPSWRNFTYQELKQATDDFNSDKLIGKGGHAEVYKGYLPDGQVVAVKKIKKENKKDEDRVGDFLAELGIIAHIDHPNTAKLVGFSADNGFHLVLQFSPHGSLATVLHGCTECLEWKLRYKVAVGIAEGLQYLHCNCQRRIIHRDITASNILLSADYEPEISDFGLAKWLPEEWGHLVVSPIEGTFGYLAPEYFMHGMVNEKTDIFAFGVLLLELITGRRAVDSSSQSLVMWAKPLLDKNKMKEIADPRLGETYNSAEMRRTMLTASACIHHSPDSRPNMKRVVQLLKGENEGLADMKQKSMGSRSFLLDAFELEEYNSTAYLKDLNRHMELVME
ncbi:Receptor-like cytosolic serine/threonine-protein kinase RBK1 [Striga hermonthica]|uniref:non-specific serine/threonine protein kinase n=1 Tax=Striga hermonthica TaxID=68872 RepID=A0A9N7NIP3_STRHE|nr:Receptor-like cytosolic serine/threonine-protein kinase RBK1 [Striga hermonthica]